MTQTNETYNGWANYETWNVAMWIQKDPFLYHVARASEDYAGFLRGLALRGLAPNDAGLEDIKPQTPDGVSYTDPKLDLDALDEMIREL